MKQPERRKSCFKCCNVGEQFSEGEGQKGRLETVSGGMGRVEQLDKSCAMFQRELRVRPDSRSQPQETFGGRR